MCPSAMSEYGITVFFKEQLPLQQLGPFEKSKHRVFVGNNGQLHDKFDLLRRRFFQVSRPRTLRGNDITVDAECKRWAEVLFQTFSERFRQDVSILDHPGEWKRNLAEPSKESGRLVSRSMLYIRYSSC